MCKQDKQGLTYGMDYRHNTFSSNFLNEFSKEDRFGVYVQDEWHLTNKLSATGGLRLDLHTEINPTYSPRFAAIYKLFPNHTVRGTITLAFRPPTIFETNNFSRSLPAMGLLLGSKHLSPEQIVSYELSYQGWFFKHRLRARIDVFLNHVSDLISSRAVPPGNPTLTFVNGGEADIHGGEVGVEFWPLPWLSGFVNYAYQDIDQNLTGTVRRGGPHHKVNTGLRGEWDNGLNVEAAIHYVGAATYPISSIFAAAASITGSPAPNTRVDSYTLINLRGGYRFWNDQLELAISIFNALNDKHKEHPLGEIIGSRAMGWITFSY